ncbi:MAG: alanine racemase [Flavobacteriales bacterium]|jgi:alanine racemase
MSHIEYSLKKLDQALQRKTHVTVLEIDLDAIAHNLKTYRQELKTDVLLLVMVKAQGYGTGACELARFLEFSEVDYLGVAYTDEGVELRSHGIRLPTMVMNPERGSLEELIDASLEPVIYSFATLERFALALKTKEIKEVYPIHLKVDTGMHRLGFQASEMELLVKKLKEMPSVKVISVFTHLAATDEHEHDHFTIQQLELFRKVSKQLKVDLGHDFICHALNSVGISRFPEYQMDLVRLGIGVYGVSADPRLSLKHVATLKTIISQINDIQPGESVGYGRAYISTSARRIATIPIGYADGLFRTFGNDKSSVQVAGKKATIIGNICMDMCMIDVTGIDCAAGDEVIVFGKNPSVQELARIADTIPYEILCAVDERVKRVYIKDEN